MSSTFDCIMPIMRWPVLFLLGAALRAQPAMPIGIARGDVVSRTGTEITVRNATGDVSACSLDGHTYFEPKNLGAGDSVEVVADRQPGSAACYARTVQVVDRKRRRLAIVDRAIVESATKWLAPRGDLMFGGIVLRRSATTLTLKTHDGEKLLVLRPDTRYWCDALRSAVEELIVNTRVYVRAGRDFEGNVEVYQAAWGAIVPAPF
jgi:hypothetical protein